LFGSSRRPCDGGLVEKGETLPKKIQVGNMENLEDKKGETRSERPIQEGLTQKRRSGETNSDKGSSSIHEKYHRKKKQQKIIDEKMSL